jgi:uncharacterized protein (DUF362 family)
MRSLIATAKSGYEDANANLGRALALLDISALDVHRPVVIKINMCDARPAETGAITHPLFLDAVLHHLRANSENLKIYVVESDATVALADKFLQWFGFVPVLQKWNAEFMNLSKTRTVNKEVKGRYFKEIAVPEILAQPHFFITTPKPKINPIATITCCLKNQFGCLPAVEKGIYHAHLDDVIADLNSVIHPDLCLVDAITAQGSIWGPALGTPIPLKAIICSRDPVAVDSYCARLMGFNPWLIGHIRKSASSGVGSMKYTLTGDKIAKVDFETSKLQLHLLKFAGSLRRRTQRQFRAEGRRRG